MSHDMTSSCSVQGTTCDDFIDFWSTKKRVWGVNMLKNLVYIFTHLI